VDIGVGAAEIAQCPLGPRSGAPPGEPLVSGTPAGGGHSQPHFERHVESRDASGELNPTEVVKEYRTRDQFEDAIEPPRGLGISSVARPEPEGAETSDQRDEQPFVARIVRDVEEGVLRGISLSDRSGSAAARRLVTVRFLAFRSRSRPKLPSLSRELGYACRDAEDAAVAAGVGYGVVITARVVRPSPHSTQRGIFVSTCPKGYVPAKIQPLA